MSGLNWKIPPNEADTHHGRYAVVSVFGRFICVYQENHADEWEGVGMERISISGARSDGDDHNRYTLTNADASSAINDVRKDLKNIT